MYNKSDTQGKYNGITYVLSRELNGKEDHDGLQRRDFDGDRRNVDLSILNFM